MFDGNHRPRRDVNLSGRRRINFLTATGNDAKSLVETKLPATRRTTIHPATTKQRWENSKSNARVVETTIVGGGMVESRRFSRRSDK
jgi:hypothetical protein